jgi:transposase-like protein
MAPFKQVHVPAHLRDPSYVTGRPSEYRLEYCEAVQEYMAKGYSLTAFAGHIRVAPKTVYEWIKRHSDFGNAVSRARGARIAALEIKLLASRKGAETTAAIFALKNACPDEWRDVRHTEHTHAIAPRALTDAQLEAIAAGHSPADVGIIDGSATRLGEK